MAVDSPEFIDSALKVYNIEVHRAIKAQEGCLTQLIDAHNQLQDSISTVAELPAKLRYQVMVPLGRHAFFPGHLTRTNEILVHLGDQYFVETSAVAAKGVLERKLTVLAEGVSKAQQQLQAFKARLEVTHSSLKDECSGENAVEIRSSLEESDALLATASKHRCSQAPAAAGQQQQQHGTIRRVKASSGYSYTPLGANKVQVSTQEQPDPQDAALQARLQELIRLEEQQEAAEHAGQQQQLAPIQEVEEADEDDAGQMSVASQPAAIEISSRPPRSVAMQHLQQLEQEADSDDEDENEQRQQQQATSLLDIGKVVEQLPQLASQQQQQSVMVARAAALGTSSSSGSAISAAVGKAGSGVKSSLKKGFLTSPSKSGASSSSAANQNPSVSSSSSSASSSASSTVIANSGNSAKSTAFTGTVVERPAPVVLEKGFEAPSAAAVGARLEKQVAQPPAAPGAGSSTAGNRTSRFKLRRMGMESED